MSGFQSKLPATGTTIFTVMSALAKETGAINLSQGYPDFDCDERLKQLAYQYMQEGHNQYAPMRGVEPLLEQIMQKVHRLYHLTLDHQKEITVTSGAAEAIFSALTALVHPGDEVIVFDPAYDLYKPAIEINGGKPIPYQLKAPDFLIDWEEVRSLVNQRTRAIVINTPHNPIGRIMSREDMLALQAIVVEAGIYLVSDEVYEHLVFDGYRHESVLRYPDLFQRSFVTFSFGKTFHNTGWRVGYCIAPEALTSEFRKVHQFNVFTVITPIQYALAAYLDEPEHYLTLPAFFQKKRDFLRSALEGTPFKRIDSRGTYFELYDYSAVSDRKDVDFVKELTIQYGVAAIPISVFYTDPDPDARIMRLCFGKTEQTLAAAAERLAAV